MRTIISKTPTNQILSFESRAALQAFIEKENEERAAKIKAAKSPCLIPERQGQACTHRGCYQTHVFPKYNSITAASIIEEKKDFTHFVKHDSSYESGESWVTAVNPYNEDNARVHGDFEFFRQAHPFKASGAWPEGRSLFHRSEVEIVFEEYDTWISNQPLDINLNSPGSGPYYVENYINVKDVREVIKFKQVLVN